MNETVRGLLLEQNQYHTKLWERLLEQERELNAELAELSIRIEHVGNVLRDIGTELMEDKNDD